MDTKEYSVYIHTNKSNGKVYIGLTKMRPEDRWKNGCGYHIGTHFRNAIEKYGWDGFNHEVIHNGLTKSEAEELEKHYIFKYNATNRLYGYNMSPGGETGGHPQSEETRRKISQHHRGFDGRRHTEESLQKMSESHSGENHPNFGQHLSEETKSKISAAHRRNRNRKIFCVELDCIFGSLDEAADATNCLKSGIVTCCQGKSKSCKGYHFQYAI